MHILFLSDNFPPEVNAPASRSFEHCREWVRAGHAVTVITCAPNFPTGKVYPGYRNRVWQSETMDGIRVIRVWTYIAANAGFLWRILDYLSFMLAATVAASFVRRVDVIVGTSPQFFTACAARLVAALKRRPWVFELRDLWPASIRAVGALRRQGVLELLERLELYLYRRANAVVSVTWSFRDDLIARGIDPTKIAVVTNGVDLSHFSPRSRDQELETQLGLRGCFVAGYVGTHGMAHALETLLEAAERLRQQPDGERIRLLLIGDGARKQALRALAKARGLDNVLFLDSVPKQQVVRYWSLLDVAVIHLRRSELFTTVIPSKLFEAMGMGIPVLLGVAGESAAIVEAAGCGETFTPEDASALAERLLALSQQPARLAAYREAARVAAQTFDRRTLAGRMLGVLEAVAVGRPLPEFEERVA